MTGPKCPLGNPDEVAFSSSLSLLITFNLFAQNAKNVSTGGTHKSWFATSVGIPRWEEKKEDEATIVDRAASGDEKGRTDRAASCDEKKTMKAPESSHGHEHEHGKQSADHVGDDRSRKSGTEVCAMAANATRAAKPIHKARSSAYVDVGSSFILILLLIARSFLLSFLLLPTAVALLVSIFPTFAAMRTLHIAIFNCKNHDLLHRVDDWRHSKQNGRKSSRANRMWRRQQRALLSAALGKGPRSTLACPILRVVPSERLPLQP
ncbi:hypothetical protein G5I_11133 [Acromyrmex echinatior]|uniref:Uncharacterized protein n=1 Tax=Acromyrmex echinatior TaxID=103372 RepID=F4WYR9_ACREC|nr:hypothetical protein G5I_11133 [Acromyrmex echinatior]